MVVEYCFMLWGIFAFRSIAVHGQPSTQGFISIDCGLSKPQGYKDAVTSIPYISDVDFIDTGANKNISPEYVTSTLPTQLSTLRSFPTGERNCYALSPATMGQKYLLRASFLHGNYDGSNGTLGNRPTGFDLYLGANHWTRIMISDPSTVYVAEVLTIAMADWISICLVNTNSGTPFVSSLELRPLKATYPDVNATNPTFVLVDRRNAGSLVDRPVRYPDDPYDRLWQPLKSNPSQVPISTTSKINYPSNDDILVPYEVLRTAITPAANGSSLDLSWSTDEEKDGRLPEPYFIFHFVDFQSGAARIFDIYLNGDPWFSGYTPSYLYTDYVHTTSRRSEPSYSFSIRKNKGSSLPPILNAVEVFTVLRRDEVETDGGDVNAIMDIKRYYQLKRNWMGDPCAPRDFAWDGLNCSYTNTAPPRIIALNLSSSNLTSEISASFANLKSIETLDLSGNDLMGTIPDFLAELTSLRLLNLSGNHFSGSIPPLLLSRSQRGNLTLSDSGCDGLDKVVDAPPGCRLHFKMGKVHPEVGSNSWRFKLVFGWELQLIFLSNVTREPSSFENNPGICNNDISCNKKKNIAVILAVVLSIAAVLLVVVFFAWKMRRRMQGNAIMMPQYRSNTRQLMNDEENPLQAESQQFSYAELEKITKNFQREIGKGGFGTVYHGCLKNGTQVAVKLRSESSSQGSKELITEAQVLTRVHHRNLVPLVGFCSDGSYMALVYEYMPQGNLEEHLKGNASNPEVLSWGARLCIALETAQGLEYLHYGCQPPIIHRDVKTTNILLNEKLEAKIADFGLSRSFHNEYFTHVSTKVMGTAGYLDPEYYITSQLTEKSDVYSFGVVLLELITGQPAVLPRPEPCHIRQYVEQRLSRGEISHLIDPRLRVESDANSVWTVVDIAMKCTVENPRQRPSMSDVVVQLKEALTLEASRERSTDFTTEPHHTSETLPFELYHCGSMTGPMAR